MANTLKPLKSEKLIIKGFFKQNLSDGKTTKSKSMSDCAEYDWFLVYFQLDSKSFFISIAHLYAYLKINEIYFNKNSNTEFTSEFSIDWKFVNYDERYFLCWVFWFDSIFFAG